jgi:hypothetical protein
MNCVFPSRNAPAIGIDLLFGAGQAWGNVPEYARFYGGNQAGNFLYNGINEPSVSNFPSGPLIRSFGRNQASTQTTSNSAIGGTNYWNVSLTASLPLPFLSKPLIPAETVIEGATCQDCKSLKDILKTHVSSGKNMLIDNLAFQQLSPQQRTDLEELDRDNGLRPEEEARLESAENAFEQARTAVKPEADKIWAQLMPTINYIADHANLYSIKPIIMFDAAHISSQEDTNPHTRLALGGGLQFNLVVAKFEVGYLKTLRYQPGDDHGNFVVRLVFEKFF